VILVDSSVWIDHFRRVETERVLRLRAEFEGDELLVGDLVLCEVLQGFRTDAQAQQVEEVLRAFEVVTLTDPDLAVAAAANYRFLRSRGVTVRTTIDLIIGTFCIERGHSLLHSDRDFESMERLLGLQRA
jgi:predicted nucleic acid-binding protein